MSGRGEKNAPERPDDFSDLPEEFAQHPVAAPRDLARREREQADRDAAASADPDSALARIEAAKKRVREIAGE